MYSGRVAAIRRKFEGKASSSDKLAADPSNPPLPEIIDQIGCGPSQLRFLLTGGGVYCADGSVLLLVSAIASTLGFEWGLTSTQRGLLVTVVCLGVLAGNWTCGPLCDKYGRRYLVLASYLNVFAFGFASSLAQSYFCLMTTNFMVGFGMGLGIPAWNALATEVTPRYYRIIMQASGQLLFTFGEIFCAILLMMDDPTMDELHWRGLFQVAAVPGAIFFVIAFIFLHQSPAFLALAGRYQEARRVLRCMAQENFHHEADVDVNFKIAAPQESETGEQPPTSKSSQFGLLFGKQLRSTTLVCLSTCFVANTVYFGTIYAFPQVLPGLGSNSGSAAVQLLIGALWEIPGITFAVLVGMSLPRKRVLKIGLYLNGAAAISFAIGTTTPLGLLNEIFYHFGYYGIKCFIIILFITMYQYTSEVFPTALRGTGNSLVIGGGRVGAMAAPLFFEFFYETTGSHATYFYLMGMVCLMNALIVDWAPFEPTQMVLKESIDDDEEEEDADRSS